MEKIKSFKGFNKDLTCRGFQYQEGEEYETNEAKSCEKGFHACPYPLDIFGYYPPADSVYHEVEQSGNLDRSESDKIASTRIKIGARLDIIGLVKAAVEYVKERCTNEFNAERGKAATAGNRGAATAGNRGAATAGNYGAATAGNYGAATAGDRGAATAGNYGAATAGYRGAATAGYSGAATAGYSGAATAGNYGAATAGNYGAATAGDSGAATAGYSGAATAGNSGAATAGNYGAATAGNRGAATAGDSGAATARGKASSGEYGLSVVRGYKVQAKGGIGALLVFAEESENSYKIKHWKVVVVDGEKVKPNTWYQLDENGELIESKE